MSRQCVTSRRQTLLAQIAGSLLVVLSLLHASFAQPPSAQSTEQPSAQPKPSDSVATGDMAELHAKFQRLLTGAKMRGLFTVDGQPLKNLQEEAYDISKVEKMPEGDLWAITTRIKYGEHDLTVPIAVEVKWAGKTPVIVLDELPIPGLGTFSARVVLHKDKYAGTWQHDAVGGHLFGTIELGQ